MNISVRAERTGGDMDQEQIRQILSGRRRGAFASLLRAGLWAACGPYAAAMRIRRWGYNRHLLASKSVGVPVISVGNITAGGTGKTPMVAWVVAQLNSAGASPAILTRGYKAGASGSDEAQLLEQLTDAKVFVNPDRCKSAVAAIDAGADVLVMDDGFQHLRINRDLDIVLIDATNPFGYGHVLPRGLLREPAGALRDADAVVITRSDAVQSQALGELRARLGALAPGATLHLAIHKPVAVIDEQGRRVAPEALGGKKVCAFCGIANPEAFFRSVEDLGAKLVCTCAFNDHVTYTMDRVEQLARSDGYDEVELLITTQKDAVKLRGIGLGRPVWQLAVQIEIVEGQQELSQKLSAVAPPIASPPRCV